MSAANMRCTKGDILLRDTVIFSWQKGGGFGMKSKERSSDSPLPGRSTNFILKSQKEKCHGNVKRT